MREQNQEGGTAEPWFAGSKPSSRRAYGIICTRSRCEFQAFFGQTGGYAMKPVRRTDREVALARS
jgi:hypothetical protein